MHLIGFRKSILMAALCAAALNGIAAFAQQDKDNVDRRVQRLTHRVNTALENGTITKDKADELKATLSSISSDAATARKKNGGALNPTDLTGFESKLNQQFNVIGSFSAAGERKTVNSQAAGPKWAQGQDGAQDTNKLKHEMKEEEARELRQERQSLMQVKEMQQQQYEKEMLQKLGGQRPEILQNKQQIDQIRDTSGAN
jgi:opacity protein-like surface antigen